MDEKHGLGEETVHEWGDEYSNGGVAVRVFVVNSWMVLLQNRYLSEGEVAGGVRRL